MPRFHRTSSGRIQFTAEEEAEADAIEEAEKDILHNEHADFCRQQEYETDGDNFDALWKAIDALRQGNDMPSEVTDILARRAATKAAYPKR